MKLTLCLCIFLYSLFGFASEEWTKNVFRKNKISHFYVGVSSSQMDLKLAMDEAYQNAISEAIKHNFGFYQNFQEASFQTLKGNEYQQLSQLYLAEIKLAEIIPRRKSVEKIDGRYLVYREIEYPIAQIKKEQNRILKKKPIENKLKLYSKEKTKDKQKKAKKKALDMSIVYLPFQKLNNEGSFHLLPFRFEYSPSYYSFGVGFLYDQNEHGENSNYTITDLQIDMDFKFVLKTRYFSFGLGAMVLYKSRSLEQGYETLDKVSLSALAPVAALKWHIGSGQRLSFHIEGFQYEDNGENVLKEYRAGLSFNF